ncbi:subclass B1 metallo-beta-lactamase [bacterium]|nr:subclass B1 metallo-beta-lactamase [bacterium]
MHTMTGVFSCILLWAAAVAGQQAQILSVTPDIELIPLDDGYYIHRTWYDFNTDRRMPSNGLLLVRNGFALLVDTPNTDEQTGELYRYVRDSLRARISTVICGHSHSDCLGGLGWLHRRGVSSIAGDKTRAICIEQGLPVPDRSFADSLSLTFEGEPVLCEYSGGGHTIDNITVWFPASRILFGGCLVRSVDARTLGFTGEAVPEQWAETIAVLQERHPDAQTVIPGHGEHGGPALLDHTIALVREFLGTKEAASEDNAKHEK